MLDPKAFSLEISLEISENVRMRVLKNAITEVLGKSFESVSESEKKSSKAVSLASIDKNENEKTESEKIKVKK